MVCIVGEAWPLSIPFLNRHQPFKNRLQTLASRSDLTRFPQHCMTNTLISCPLQEPSSLHHLGVECPTSLLLDCFKIWHHSVNRTESREPGQLSFSCQNSPRHWCYLSDQLADHSDASSVWPMPQEPSVYSSIYIPWRNPSFWQQPKISTGTISPWPLSALPSPTKTSRVTMPSRCLPALPTMLLKVEHVTGLTMY